VSEDDVIDFMVVEAVTLKVQAEDEQAAKVKEKTAWKKDVNHLKGLKPEPT